MKKPKRPYIAVALGSVRFTREEWAALKHAGYTRQDVRNAIVEAGQDELRCLIDRELGLIPRRGDE